MLTAIITTPIISDEKYLLPCSTAKNSQHSLTPEGHENGKEYSSSIVKYLSKLQGCK